MSSVYPISADSHLCVWSAHRCTITGPFFEVSGHSPLVRLLKLLIPLQYMVY